MCGIVGVAGDVTVSRERLLAMRDSMRHRGPDDAGVWWSDDGRVGLGHRRLAIIDLSAAGHQPMTDSTGSLHIIFNGEIYNYLELRQELEALGHRFRTASDTEVILEAYLAVGYRLPEPPQRHVCDSRCTTIGSGEFFSRATRQARNRCSSGTRRARSRSRRK